MHDIDRTQREFEAEVRQLQSEQFEFPGETGEYGEGETGEAYETWQEAPSYEFVMDESGLQEAEEMELAAEMLEVTNEAELDHFLGNLIRRVGNTIGKVVKSPLGNALARTTIPRLALGIKRTVVRAP